jgi:peptidoglycan-associated lipoprotein
MKRILNEILFGSEVHSSIKGNQVMKRTRYGVMGMSGGQKTDKMKTAIGRKLVAAGLILTCLGTASPAVADFGSATTLKLGVSGLYNHRLFARQAIVGLRQVGGHVSVDFTVPGYDIAFSPFLDIYHRVQNDASATRPRNDSATNIIGGINFLFTGFRSEQATMYMGIGGGVARMKVVDVVNVPVTTTYYRTRMMANALMGLEVKLVPNISFFVEPHYVWTTKMLNGLSTHVGLAFHSSTDKATPQRSAPPVYTPTPRPVYTPATPPAPKAPEPMKKVEEVKASSAEALATMQEVIHFQHDRSDLSDSAKVILDNKVTIFRENPAMRIVIVGFASQPGTADYNMALGLRRAEAAKAYLVSMGVDPIRVEIATRGEGQLLVEGPGEGADAENRRGQFRLLIADPFLVAPK